MFFHENLHRFAFHGLSMYIINSLIHPQSANTNIHIHISGGEPQSTQKVQAKFLYNITQFYWELMVDTIDRVFE